ncbi:MAG: hypothetical protein ACOVOV_14725, partial [Dolichospermum sp.]
ENAFNTPTLAQVTTAGNTTTNAITVGGLTVGQVGGSGTISFPTTVSGHLASIYSVYAGNKIVIQVGSRTFNLDGGGQITTNFNTVITGSTGAAALVVQQGNAAWSPVADFNGSAGTALRVNTNGNILIGTTTDAGYKLDVNGIARVGASGGSGQLYIKGFAGTGQYLYLDDGATVWSLIGGTDYVIQENGTTRLAVKAGGNVGIGTSSPTHKLQVDGSVRFGAGAGGLYWDNVNQRLAIGSSTPSYAFELYGVGFFNDGIIIANGQGIKFWVDKVRIQPATTDSLGFYTGTTVGSPLERMRIVSSGNVLINTTTDSGYKLDVNGTVRIKGTGTTGSTIALSVQNNTPTTIFTIADDGVTTVNNPSTNVNTRFSGTTIDFYSFSTQLASIGKGNWNSNSTITFQASLTGSNDLRVGSSFVRARASLQVGNSDNSIINGSWTGKVLTLGNGLGNGEVTEITSANPTTFPASQSDIFFYGGVGSGGNAGDIFVQHNNTSKRGNLIIGTNTRTASAIVSIASTTQGFLQPRMTNAEALAITTPATGLQVYDTTNNKNL